MTDKQPTDDKGEETEHAKRRRYWLTRSNYTSVIEEQIREAQERGDFDNLPGEGKPIDLEVNPYAGDKEMAYKMLKDNNYTLPWIEDRNELLEEIDVFRKKMLRQQQVFGPQIAALKRSDQLGVAKHRWMALLAQWEEKLIGHNARIDAVNLSIPVNHLKLIKLDLDAELIRVGATRSLD